MGLKIPLIWIRNCKFRIAGIPDIQALRHLNRASAPSTDLNGYIELYSRITCPLYTLTRAPQRPYFIAKNFLQQQKQPFLSTAESQGRQLFSYPGKISDRHGFPVREKCAAHLFSNRPLCDACFLPARSVAGFDALRAARY